MDQLKVILEHRFWVLSVLAVLIPPIGWWVSTGDMATQTDIRTGAIRGKVKSLETLKKDLSKAANKDWIEAAKQVNGKLAGLVDQTQKRLYEHQRPVMVMHPFVRHAFEEAQVKYRGDSDTARNPHAFFDMKRLFMSRYVDMWRTDVYEVVSPFDMVTGDGKVLCTDQNGSIQITRAPVEIWQQRQMISTAEMWDAQEDLWMLHALMQAVARVNEGSLNIDDARIKRLISATLRGGSETDLMERRKKKSTTGPGGQNTPSVLNNPFASRSDSDTGPKALPLIDPNDIFGSAEEAGTAASPMTLGAKKQTAGEPPPVAPYVVRAEGKWRARGFVLRVVMDHQEIPKLLTVLTEAPFPVQIYHVEHEPYDFQKNRQSTVAAENEADQKRLKANEERLNLAMNQVNLAEVLVAGTFIFYDEPSTPAEQASAASSAAPASVKAQQPGKAANGAPVPPTGAKAAGPATSVPGAGSAPKAASPGKAPGAAGSPGAPQSPKSAAPASPRAPGATTPKPVQPVKP